MEDLNIVIQCRDQEILQLFHHNHPIGLLLSFLNQSKILPKSFIEINKMTKANKNPNIILSIHWVHNTEVHNTEKAAMQRQDSLIQHPHLPTSGLVLRMAA